jgi:hypothetical protein
MKKWRSNVSKRFKIFTQNALLPGIPTTQQQQQQNPFFGFYDIIGSHFAAYENTKQTTNRAIETKIPTKSAFFFLLCCFVLRLCAGPKFKMQIKTDK